MAKEIETITDEELMEEVFGADDPDGLVSVKLRRPFEWEGETYTELSFDFYAPTGGDCAKINRELNRRGIFNWRANTCDDYILRYAALSCKQPVGTDMLEALPSADYLKIRSACASFLLRWER